MPAKVIDVQDTALEPHFLITGDKNAKADAKKHFNAYGQRPDKHSCSVIPAPQPLARVKGTTLTLNMSLLPMLTAVWTTPSHI